MVTQPKGPAPAESAQGRPRVVVGVDGSPQSVRALQQAGQEAIWREATLVVVNAWQRPESTTYPGYVVVMVEPTADLEKESRELVDEALREAFGADRPAVPVTTRTMEDRASAALINAAKGAALLVVGSRGLGGLRSMLGSTSRSVVTHATCPVLVVRPPAHGVNGTDASQARAESQAQVAVG